MRFFPFFSRYFSVKLSLIMKIVFLFHFLSFYSNELCDVPLHYFTERCNNDEHWIKNLNLTQFKIYMFYMYFFYTYQKLFILQVRHWGYLSLCVWYERTKINGGIQKSISSPFHRERFIYLYYFTLSRHFFGNGTPLFQQSKEKAHSKV